MYRVLLIALISFLTQAHAEEVAATSMNDPQISMDDFADELMKRLANKLVDRVEAAFTRNEDLDAATLGKPGHLGIPDEIDLPDSFGQEEDDDNQQESMLDSMLNLRGGAKAAMKAPAKSPMKAMKGMNEYFTKLAEARKADLKSFVYNGKTYVQGKAKTGMVIYKAKK